MTVMTSRDESIKALQSKGFTVYAATSEKDFLDNLQSYDEAWFSSSEIAPDDPKKVILGT